MNAMPKPVSIAGNLVTLTLEDWDSILDMVADAEDRAAIERSHANPETDPLRRGWTAGEMRRLLDGEPDLRVLRDRTGLTQRDLAEKAGVSCSYLAEIESGRKPGSAKALARLAKALDVPAEFLLPD